MNPSLFGESVTFTATVAAVSPGVTPTGMVTFKVCCSASMSDTAALSGGQATFMTSSLGIGKHTFTATYEGDAVTASSISKKLAQDVGVGPTTTELSATPNPALPGQMVSLTATVAARPPAAGTPEGTVTFLDRNTVLGSVPLNGGVATLGTAALAIGSHRLTAQYEGSAEFAESRSAKHLLEVDARVGEAFRIDSDSDPDSATDNKHSPDVAALARGGFVVAWQSSARNGRAHKVYAQRFRTSGETVGDAFRIGAAVGNSQWAPSIAGLSGGAFVVAWEADEPDGTAVYVQRYTGATRARGRSRAGKAMPETANASARPAVAGLADGGFVVAWASRRGGGTGFDVYARRYAANAKPAGAELRVNRRTANRQLEPSVAALADGGFVVTWSSNAVDQSSFAIYGQRYDDTGKTVDKEFRITPIRRDHAQSSVAGRRDGGFIVASAMGSAPIKDILAARYDAAGARVEGAFRVNTARNKMQYQPSAAAFPEGGFAMAWTSREQDGSGNGIQARIYDALGAPVDRAFRVDGAIPDALQGQPSVAALSNGLFVGVWTSQDLTTRRTSIHGQRLKVNGLDIQ
jgi:hypothetical protein